MKKFLIFTLLLFMFSLQAQSKKPVPAAKITAEQVEKTSDTKIIAAFIKDNPDHPKTPEFKRKLAALVMSNQTPSQQQKIAKPVIKPASPESMKVGDIKKPASSSTPSSSTSTSSTSSTATTSSNTKTTASKPTDAKTQAAVDLLNHMFSNDPNKKTAYIAIKNKSKCNLVIKIAGKKFYNLTVPSNGQNFILVDKGTYTLTTSVCDAKYSSKKVVDRDLEITLGAVKK